MQDVVFNAMVKLILFWQVSTVSSTELRDEATAFFRLVYAAAHTRQYWMCDRENTRRNKTRQLADLIMFNVRDC